MTEPVRGSGFRTLTESLRQRMPDSVITLVSLRPDLAQPVPHDLAELTAHATMSALGAARPRRAHRLAT